VTAAAVPFSHLREADTEVDRQLISTGCRKDKDCRPGYECNTRKGRCVSSGCVDDNDCKFHEECDTRKRVCVSPEKTACSSRDEECCADGDCKYGDECKNRVCVSPEITRTRKPTAAPTSAPSSTPTNAPTSAGEMERKKYEAVAEAAYCRVLRRQPESNAAITRKVDWMLNGGNTAKDLMRQMILSREFEVKFVEEKPPKTVATTLYDVLLDRAPDDGGLNNKINDLGDSNSRFERVVDDFLASGEYFSKFGEDDVPGGGRASCNF
jgi:hypothetical protein